MICLQGYERKVQIKKYVTLFFMMVLVSIFSIAAYKIFETVNNKKIEEYSVGSQYEARKNII